MDVHSADSKKTKTRNDGVTTNGKDDSGKISLKADFPNFNSALQIKEEESAIVRPGVVNRPIYPNIPYSPYSSPRAVRRKSPLKESRRVSIDECGTYQQLNQYKLIDSIGQVRKFAQFLLFLNILLTNY